jgi:hypothetical protein
MLRRNAALEKTTRKYRDKHFVWGKYDCLKMARSHLVAMGRKRLPKMPHYQSPLGAKRALTKAGHQSLESLFDALLPRIAPAFMLAGDICVVEGEGMQCVMICVGKKIFGWHEDAPTPVNVVPYQDQIIAAWRA